MFHLQSTLAHILYWMFRVELSFSGLMLMQCGYPPINAKLADRRRYYDCFGSYYKDHTTIPMVEMLAEYLEVRLRQYLEILECNFHRTVQRPVALMNGLKMSLIILRRNSKKILNS